MEACRRPAGLRRGLFLRRVRPQVLLRAPDVGLLPPARAVRRPLAALRKSEDGQAAPGKCSSSSLCVFFPAGSKMLLPSIPSASSRIGCWRWATSLRCTAPTTRTQASRPSTASPPVHTANPTGTAAARLKMARLSRATGSGRSRSTAARTARWCRRGAGCRMPRAGLCGGARTPPTPPAVREPSTFVCTSCVVVSCLRSL